jgi:hypothetical protein
VTGLLFTLLLSAQNPAPAPAAPVDDTPDQVYRRGKAQFEFGDCAKTIDTLAPLAVPGSLGDERLQLDVHRMLGVCYALTNRQLESAREFSSLLSIDPDATLDPFLTPPVAVEVFERQKATMKAQLEEIRRARERAKDGTLDEGGLLVERRQVVKETPLAAAFLPFGLAQAANGETAKAVVIGTIQGVTLATNITGYWISMADPKVVGLTTHQVAWYTHIIAAMGFALSYGYGVTDALISREDQKVIEDNRTKRPLTPEELKKLEDVPAPPGAPPPAPSPKPVPTG